MTGETQAEIWDRLARLHGRKAVMNLGIDDATLDSVTAEQISYLAPLIGSLLTGKEHSALDYGCGAGRFTRMIADAVPNGPVIAYDPSPEMLGLAPYSADYKNRILHDIGDPEFFFRNAKYRKYAFDLVFIFGVLGGIYPDNLPLLVRDISSIIAPGGLLVLCEHTIKKAENTWWHFYPQMFYETLWRNEGIVLEKSGELMQLDNSVTVMTGRKTCTLEPGLPSSSPPSSSST